MPLLSLSDDVLLLIFSLFRGREALPSSLTCKRVYPLAIARVASLAACKSPAQLRRLCEYYLSSDALTGEPRAKYLEDLHIYATTFKQKEKKPNGAELVPAHLIVELLSHAHNIRRLALDEFLAAVKAEPRIPLALSSMQRLAQIRLSMVADPEILDALERIGNPKRLTFACLVYDEEYSDGCHSMPRLLVALSMFHNLHTLMVWDFKPWIDEEDAPPIPPLPAVRYLLLSWTSPFTVSIVEHCPNLSNFMFAGDFDIADETESIGPRWRPLRRVTLGEARDGVCVVDRLGSVSLLQVREGLFIKTLTARSVFFEVLRLASPIGLSFGLDLDPYQSPESSFWKDMSSAAPMLRSLELKLEWSFSWSGQSYDQALRHVLDGLKEIPLSILKILIPQTSVPRRKDAGRRMSPAAYEADLATAKSREKERVLAVAALPPLFVDVVPSLNYFSLGDMAPNPALTDDADPFESSDEADSNQSENSGVPKRLWNPLREIGPSKQMWWKVVEEDGRRVMIEISANEGEQVKREMELQDDEEMLRIEGESALYLTLCTGC